jgi:hypothetical protein
MFILIGLDSRDPQAYPLAIILTRVHVIGDRVKKSNGYINNGKGGRLNGLKHNSIYFIVQYRFFQFL